MFSMQDSIVINLQVEQSNSFMCFFQDLQSKNMRL